MRRLLFLCLGLLTLLGACGPIYDTQYSLVPPTSVEGRNCVGQCQQNRGICRQNCSIAQQSCLNDSRSRALYEYRAYVSRQTAEKKPIKKSVSDFERSYGCSANSCEERCDADYRDCFGGVCGGQVIARKVCTAFCDQPPAPALAAAPSAAATGGPMSVPPASAMPAAPASTMPDDRSLCRPGMRIEAQWKDEWYPATVRAPLRADGRCPIHYDGYGKEDDEAVSLKRIRPR